MTRRPTPCPSLKFTPLPLVAGAPIGRGVITIRGVRAWETEDYTDADEQNSVTLRENPYRTKNEHGDTRKYTEQVRELY